MKNRFLHLSLNIISYRAEKNVASKFYILQFLS